MENINRVQPIQVPSSSAKKWYKTKTFIIIVLLAVIATIVSYFALHKQTKFELSGTVMPKELGHNSLVILLPKGKDTFAFDQSFKLVVLADQRIDAGQIAINIKKDISEIYKTEEEFDIVKTQVIKGKNATDPNELDFDITAHGNIDPGKYTMNATAVISSQYFVGSQEKIVYFNR